MSYLSPFDFVLTRVASTLAEHILAPYEIKPQPFELVYRGYALKPPTLDWYIGFNPLRPALLFCPDPCSATRTESPCSFVLPTYGRGKQIPINRWQDKLRERGLKVSRLQEAAAERINVGRYFNGALYLLTIK